MKKAFIYFLALALFTSCQKEDVPRDLPECVKDRMAVLKNNPVQNPPAQVWQYTYQGRAVYYVPPVCCDQMGQLYDQNCNLICSPDGGITGAGDGKCTDFFSTRTNGILLWEDNRKS